MNPISILVKNRFCLPAFALASLLSACAGSASSQSMETPGAQSFDDDFTGKVMRVDFFHTGHHNMEIFSLDTIRVEGDWPGSRSRLVDDSNLGKYMFEIFDPVTGETLYSRGFASIYGEWETTSEAEDLVPRTFPEAMRFPEPKRDATLILYKRGPSQEFREIWNADIKPSSRFVSRDTALPGNVKGIGDTGSPSDRVDLLFLGDGYTSEEEDKFFKDATRLSGELFTVDPFQSRRGEFNVWAAFTPSADSGISNPRAGDFKNTALGCSYNSLDSDRYVLTLEDRQWRDAAAAAPHDFVIIMVNSRKYGGGGIQNLYCTVASDSEYAPYLVIHEFGHHFAGLGDEYFTSPVAYEEFIPPEVEPWEPNITALLDPDNLKWKTLSTPGIELPTPWDRDRYETRSAAIQKERATLRSSGASEAKLEDLFRQEQQMVRETIGSKKGLVGAFEGAMYQSRGLYRPAADCIMFSRSEAGFCPVCHQALDATIDQYARAGEDATPD